MKSIFHKTSSTCLAAALFLLSVSFSTAQSRDLRVSTVRLNSRILKEERTLSVSLPEDYGTSLKVYSVLYVLDAEGERTFPQCISTKVSLQKKGSVPQMIVVGIWNTQRNRDMIPASVSHRPGSGGSDSFLTFIKDELIPFINRTYRTDGFSILYGMSNSALFCVYALLEAPETFNAYIASSPMIGHCPGFIEKKTEIFVNKEAVSSRILYMIYGSNDSERVTQYVPDFQDYLKDYAPKDFVGELVILKGEGHVPQSSLARGLQFVFKILNFTI